MTGRASQALLLPHFLLMDVLGDLIGEQYTQRTSRLIGKCQYINEKSGSLCKHHGDSRYHT